MDGTPLKEKRLRSLQNDPESETGLMDETTRVVHGRQTGRVVHERQTGRVVHERQTGRVVHGRQTGSRMMTILLCVINVFLLVLVIVTAVFKSKEQTSYRNKSKLCVVCSDVKLHPYVTMEEFEFSKNNTLCCLKDEKNLSSLVEKFTEHWYKQNMAEESPRFSLCSKGSNRNHSWLKVQGVLRRKDTSTSDAYRLLHWNSHQDQYDSDDDLRYSDGYITIHDSGIYHIYSQLMRDRYSSKEMRLLTHRVVLVRNGYTEHERTIIDSTRSECKQNATKTWDTSYVGTTYQLVKGDMIGVRVDNEDQIVNGHQQNFFGVIRM